MKHVATLTLATLCSAAAWGQSSSLYVNDQASIVDDPFSTVVFDDQTGEFGVRSNQQEGSLSPAIKQVSFTAVTLPEPRTYQVNDIVTIIVRESTTAAIDASMSTKKDATWKAELAEFPDLNLADILKLDLKPMTFPDGTPKLDIKSNSKFDGEGDYGHKTEMTARLAARVLDVKPNGLLVLEARKFVENDDETMTMIVTGTCSVDEIAIDKTVLSSSLYDLHISKQHTGELRKSSKKGLLTKVIDFVFNF